MIKNGYDNQLRKMPIQNAKARLLMEIPLVAKDYGARFDLSDSILKESVRFILDKFGKLGLNEIREAFREHASGELKVQGAEMWGGEFNIAVLGKILTAYCENRGKILAEILKQQEKLEEEKQEKREHAERQRKADIEFPKMIMRQRAKITHWSEVPVFWYDNFLKKGWIEFEKGEAVEIFEEAKRLASIEIRVKEMQKVQLSTNDRLKFQMPNQSELAKIIARQLTVFKKVVEVEDWKPEK